MNHATIAIIFAMAMARANGGPALKNQENFKESLGSAKKCNPDLCRLPTCYCGGTEVKFDEFNFSLFSQQHLLFPAVQTWIHVYCFHIFVIYPPSMNNKVAKTWQ